MYICKYIYIYYNIMPYRYRRINMTYIKFHDFRSNYPNFDSVAQLRVGDRCPSNGFGTPQHGLEEPCYQAKKKKVRKALEIFNSFVFLRFL